MKRTRYRYNPETLRYERVKISIVNLFITGLSYLTFGSLFFVGLLLLQNFIRESPVEKNLRTENEALIEHKVVLAGLLEQSNQKLTGLQQEDVALYQRLFDTKDTRQDYQASGQQGILNATGAEFAKTLEAVNARFQNTYHTAKLSNNYFFNEASVRKEDLAVLFTIPSIVPVENFDLTKLVSGFGIRINPFHKGNYHHDGVDIASPRGTHVLAAGHGVITTVKHSDLLAGYGNYIEIDHGHGFVSRYSHLEGINVRIGQKIKKGQPIGTIGSSGGSVAPHLHYEVVKSGVNIDPIKFFAEGVDAQLYRDVVSKSKTKNQSLD
jgi:murein DD-endopeptidase MepM/ murein hydrolase activator NlpD